MFVHNSGCPNTNPPKIRQIKGSKFFVRFFARLFLMDTLYIIFEDLPSLTLIVSIPCGTGMRLDGIPKSSRVLMNALLMYTFTVKNIEKLVVWSN